MLPKFNYLNYLPKLSLLLIAVTIIAVDSLPAIAEERCTNYWIHPVTRTKECLRGIRTRSVKRKNPDYQPEQNINPIPDNQIPKHQIEYRYIPDRFENNHRYRERGDKFNRYRKNFNSRFNRHQLWPLGYYGYDLIQPNININLDGYYLVPRIHRRRKFIPRSRYHHHRRKYRYNNRRYYRPRYRNY